MSSFLSTFFLFALLIINHLPVTNGQGIKSFLIDYKTNLGLSLDPISDALINISLNQNDLLQLSANDLRSLLKAQSLATLHIDRLINALHHIEESKIYKDKINFLSNEEQFALELIFNKSIKLQHHIENITTTTEELNKNTQSAENKINKKFDSLIAAINQRRNNLLKKLNDLTQTKSKKLNQQRKKLKRCNNKLLFFYKQAQNMTFDASLHPHQRKQIILRKSARLLQKDDDVLKNVQVSDGYIGIAINAKKALSEIKELGAFKHRKYEISTQQTKVKKSDHTSFTFGTITNGFKHWIIGNGKKLKVMDKTDGFITSCNRKIYDSGIHTFKISVDGKISAKNAFSIVSGTLPTNTREWIGKHRYKHYYFESRTGSIYTGNGKRVSKLWKWKKNDVIVMTLDCYEWTLAFGIDRERYPPIRGEKIKIAKNKYYSCLTVAPKKGAKFEIIDLTK